MSFDLVLQQSINGLAGRSPALDALMVAFAQYSPVAYALILLAVYFLPRPDRRRRRLLALYSGLAAVISVGIGGAIGHAWYRPRPFVADPATVHLLVRHGTDASFPSDHATLAFAVATGLWGLGTAWGWALVALGAVVAFARVFVGVHWPTDVIGGALLGFLVARAILALAPRLDPVLDRTLDRLGPLGRDGRARRPG